MVFEKTFSLESGMINFQNLANRLAKIAINKDIVKWREQFINKRPANIKPILPGTSVFLVDGTKIRDLIDSDYIQGGNSLRYSWIPKNEIWIDDTVPETERFDILLHESDESQHMMKGDDYDTAHDKAKAVEDKLRHTQIPAGELNPPK